MWKKIVGFFVFIGAVVAAFFTGRLFNGGGEIQRSIDSVRRGRKLNSDASERVTDITDGIEETRGRVTNSIERVREGKRRERTRINTNIQRIREERERVKRSLRHAENARSRIRDARNILEGKTKRDNNG